MGAYSEMFEAILRPVGRLWAPIRPWDIAATRDLIDFQEFQRPIAVAMGKKGGGGGRRSSTRSTWYVHNLSSLHVFSISVKDSYHLLQVSNFYSICLCNLK